MEEALEVEEFNSLRDGAAFLRTGRKILARRPVSSRFPEDGNIVLVRVSGIPNYGTEYVTWLEDGKGNTFMGHYFMDLNDAWEDYYSR